ncbi:MAG: DUF2735 domain-containing protein [Pseudolabrys sp.]|nr:DUF2735 domain-containing protein [Pseudolabrys sp.]
MTTLQRGSAQIYTFPPRGRFASGEARKDDNVVDLDRVATTACGSAWYHDEAIREADPSQRSN